MNWKLLFILLISSLINSITLGQPKLRFEENHSLTWEETISYYQFLDEKYPEAKLITAGITDSGKPLHLFIISQGGAFSPGIIRENFKSIILVNNGIHAGESCGVDASLLFAREVLSNQEKYKQVLNNVVIAIVPILNVDGALNRSNYFRANQNGPVNQGFRANAMNMDLNRDFTKLDTRTAGSFVKIMREWDPDVLIDTHTSNGADYPYVLTLIATQKDKLSMPLSEFLYDRMLPELYRKMKEGPYEMIPYVQSINYWDPQGGIMAFMDYPRYTTGYAALFNTIGFTTEAHMFKDFRDRVLSTYSFIQAVTGYVSENTDILLKTRSLSRDWTLAKNEFVLSWKLDTTVVEQLLFRGYKTETGISQISGLPNYAFNRDSIWEQDIPYLTTYKPSVSVKAPDFYIVPQAWQQVIDRLKVNNIQYSALKRDTGLFVEYYYITDYKTSQTLNNGHYKHYAAEVSIQRGILPFMEGDLIIPVMQPAAEYLVQVLEPQGEDSFFSWNFFDGILSRKEYFSPYVFDEKAIELLGENHSLAEEFQKLQKENADFAGNHYDQIQWIYERSPYSEPTYMRYPVVRMFNEGKFP